LSYYYLPRPPVKVKLLPPEQEFYYQPPVQLYVYQPPAEEVLVEQPPELYYQPPPEPYYYQPPPQRVTYAPSVPPEPSYAEVPSYLNVTYREPQPIEYYPYQYVVGVDMFWPDFRSPPIACGVRAVPSPVRIYNPLELPIKG